MRGTGIAKSVLPAMAVMFLSLSAHAAPDLSGVWLLDGHIGAVKTTDGGAPPLTPDAQGRYEAHRKAAARGDYSYDGVTRCLPPGLPRLMLMHEPFEILQRDKIVYFLYQVNRLPRRAYLNESLPTDVDPHYLGYSVAHWDADTLVVDTAGFDDSTLLDNVGLPHSEDLHLTERYRLSPDGKHLHLTYTVEDPKTFTKPWSARADYTRQDGYRIPEEVCAATAVDKRPRQ
ncbi:MAG TPA: hypothetical protein VMF03_08245 [Steroidobacteraceae bacterium]|nr:hypothetical protein [Steroidobacteraceae bacterium]